MMKKYTILLGMGLLALPIILGSGDLAVADDEKKADKVSTLEERVVELEKALASMQSALVVMQRVYLDLQADSKGQIAIIKGNADKLGRNEAKLGQLLVLDPSTNGLKLDLLGIMRRSESFRQDVQTATTGRLVVKNPGPSWIIHVNGVAWLAPQGESSVIVPFASVGVSPTRGAAPVYSLPGAWRFDDKLNSFVLVYDLAKPWQRKSAN